ncbi:MAG: ABC transporter ATP-binding protein [Chloroflexota bacterium]
MSQISFDLKRIANSSRLKGVWQLMTGYKRVYFAAVVAVAIATFARTGIYFLLAFFVDNVLEQQPLRGGTLLPADLVNGLVERSSIAEILPWLAAMFIVLAVVQGVFTYFSGRWAAFTAESVARKLRDYLYDHLQRLTFTYHDQTQTGELISRVTSDVDSIRMFYSEQAIGIGRIAFLFIINFVGIYLLSPYLAFMSTIAVPVVIIMSIFFFREVGKAFEVFQEQESRLSNRFQEHVSGVRVVKAFARQAYEEDRFETENTNKFRVGIKFGLLHGTFWPVTDIICGAQMIFGFYLGAMMAIRGEISVGTYLAYSQMVLLIIWPIRNIGRLVTQMSTAVVSFSRVQDIIAQDREPLLQGKTRSVGSLRGEVKFDNVSFGYDSALSTEAVDKANTVGAMARQQKEKKLVKNDRLPVLHNISFEAQPGQIVALLGGTGSGKTSLVNLLDRFYEYDDGLITIDGEPLQSYQREFLRKQIGIVMQEPFLFSRSIKENIMYGVSKDVTDEEIYAAAKAAAVHDVILSFPRGYETMVGERGVTLSGGQKQRLTLARTLLRNPSILILDDATSSVDTETESQIREALNNLMANRTTFIIAHRIQSVMIADLILVLDDGRIVQRGTHEELVNQDGIYQQVFNLQAKIEDDLQAELSAAGD